MMLSIPGLFAIGLLLVAPVAAGQTTVYKCETAQGTVYSGQPCAGSNRNMEVLSLKPAPPPDMAEIERRAAARASQDARHRQLQLSRQEVTCIENRAGDTQRGARNRIQHLRQQIAALRSGTGAYNLTYATRSVGLSEQIAALQVSIDNEQSIAAQTSLNARTICARQRAAAATATAMQP